MAKATTIYQCTNCDAQFPKWMGRCEECGKWGTVQPSTSQEAAPAALQSRRDQLAAVSAATPQAFADLPSPGRQARLQTGIGEFDRVLGGGIVPGSLILLGGDPGIGKSTLVAQAAAGVNGSVLYVSGEESGEQVKLRLDRLGVKQDQLQFLSEMHTEVICKTIEERKPALLVVDSIQTVASSAVDSEPGSVNQIRASAVRFLETAKSSNIPVLLIGHVTKGGELGGPKTLEHMVDTVLYLEGDRQHLFRLLRATKNRFGSTSEVGVFEMTGEGMQQVANPSQLFLQERSSAPGSCIAAALEGNRVFLVEVQALVAGTAFGFPQRKASGFDLNRLNLILAVLSRRAGIAFDQQDVFVNVVGGASFSEPGMDLAVALAVVSSLRDSAVPPTVAAWGEIGLGGEIRSVARAKDRQAEAKRFGLTQPISGKTVPTLAEALRIIPGGSRP
jgi:DNA repair protein RadA/Sms